MIGEAFGVVRKIVWSLEVDPLAAAAFESFDLFAAAGCSFIR